MFCQISFSLKGEVTVSAVVGANISMGSYVFLQHARFLTTDSTFFTDVLSSSPASDIDILFI